MKEYKVVLSKFVRIVFFPFLNALCIRSVVRERTRRAIIFMYDEFGYSLELPGWEVL